MTFQVKVVLFYSKIFYRLNTIYSFSCVFKDNASLSSANCFSLCFVDTAIASVLATFSHNKLPFNHSKTLVGPSLFIASFN